MGQRMWGGGRHKLAAETEPRQKLAGHVILFGHNRTGSRVRPILEKLGFTVLVVDFNPEVIDQLNRAGVRAVYGDVSDHELYEQLDLPTASMIISTIPDMYDNLHLLGGVDKSNRQQVVMVTAADNFDAQRLYRAGADFVLVPNLVGGDYLAGLIEQHAGGPEKTATWHKYLAAKREVPGK
jgi:voltage-gated potassium channel